MPLRPHATAIAAALALCCGPSPVWAQAQAPGKDAAARQAEQVRRMQQQQSRLQQDLARSAAENAELTARTNSMQGELSAARAARERLASAQRQQESRATALRRDLDASEARVTALSSELEQARRELARLAGLERTLETNRAQAATLQSAVKAGADDLAALRGVDERRVAELGACREANRTLADLSSDLLAAIDRGGLGTALTGTEPFSGFKRVRIENLIQTYRDRVDEARLPAPR